MSLKNNFITICLALLCLGISIQAATVEPQAPGAYPKLRIYTDFQRMTAGSNAWRTYVSTQLVPAAVDYLTGALAIKYPRTALIRSTATQLCGINTPTVLRTGVNADTFVFFGSTRDTSGGWIIGTSLCTISTGTIRMPMINYIGINTAALEIASPSDPLLHDINIQIMIHELVHALGLNGPLFTYFLDASGNRLSNPLKTVSLSGINWNVLDLPVLTQKLRDYYGCQTIPGYFLELDGSAHPARRWFMWEFMSTGAITGSKISFTTLGFLEGTGWYVPDYTYAEPYSYGQGAGCAFYGNTINPTQFPNEYCTGNNIGCGQVGNVAGYCISDSNIRVGKVYTSQYEFNCENPAGVNYAEFPTQEIYGRGLNSKCFAGNLTTSRTGTATPSAYCLSATCMGTGRNTYVNVQFGTTTIQCTAAGQMAVPGFRGFITCPNPQTYCATVGKNYCPRNCMGRGTCVNAKCVCRSGFQGTDCGFTSAAQTPYGWGFTDL